MRLLTVIRAASAALVLACAHPVIAQLIPFSGTLSAIANVGPDPTCAPALFRGNATGSGTSTLGAFNYIHSTCLSGPGPVTGSFAFDFGDDGFAGTLAGVASPNPLIPGTSTPEFTYTISSGSGRFVPASGSFVATGLIDPRNGPTILSFNFLGRVGAIPEPSTWALMLLGFGATGWSFRQRRRQVALQAA